MAMRWRRFWQWRRGANGDDGEGWTTFLFVTLITFLVVLPVLVGTWPHSAYSRLARYTGRSVNWYGVREDPVSRPTLAESLMTGADVTAHRVQPPDADATADADADVWLLVTIVTVRREGHFYLSRVLERLQRLLAESDELSRSVRLLICNVDREPESHREAARWSAAFPMIQRRPASAPTPWRHRFEKEKQDYAFCLNASRHLFNFRHTIVLEDDAVPRDDMFDAVRHVTEYLERRHPEYLYVKLYHPERLQGYVQPEPWRIAEWLAASTLAALVVSLRFRSVRRRPVRWVAYFMALAEAVGRPHLLELRRQLLGVPFGYNLLYATECCFPGTMYSNASLLRAIEFYSSVTCRPGYAKDTALYLHYLRSSHEEAFVVEPNLVQHIGLASTLRD